MHQRSLSYAGGEGRATRGAHGRVRIRSTFCHSAASASQPLHHRSTKPKDNPCPNTSPAHEHREPKISPQHPPTLHFVPRGTKNIQSPKILPKPNNSLIVMGTAEARQGQILLPSSVLSAGSRWSLLTILIRAWVYFYVFLPANDHYNLMAAWENTDGSRNAAVRGAALTQLPPLLPPPLLLFHGCEQKPPKIFILCKK